MVQRLKEEVRARILAAAIIEFAEKGYQAATLADVAVRAAVTTSNIYKYYPSKEALFSAVVSAGQAGRLLRLLRARIRELGTIDQWPRADAGGSVHARALLDFWVEQRLVVLILLRGAEGTRFQRVRSLMIAEMERQAVRYVRQHHGEGPQAPLMRFTLSRLFARTLDAIAEILATFSGEDEIRQAFALFWRYQLAGLQSLLAVDAAQTTAGAADGGIN